MLVPIAACLAVLPAFVSAQAAPQNVSIFGGGPTNEFAVEYWRASHSTNITNAVSFPGYNWSTPITSSTSNTNISSDWQMHFNYSRVTVPTSSGNATTGLTMFSLTFPGQEWNLYSDWSLCASIALGGLSTSVAGNNSDSSCAPYIGQSCVDAILNELRSTTRFNVGCPVFPSLSSLSACSSAAKLVDSIGTSVISNLTAPDLVYNSTNYVNASGGSEVYTRNTVPFQGISSGQGFAGQLDVFPNGDLNAESKADSQKLNMIALSIVPSGSFKANNSGGYGYQLNPRLICARAQASGSPSVKNAPTAVLLSVALAVVSLLAL